MPDPVRSPRTRILESAARRGVTLRIVTFPESTHTAAEAAAAVGAELGQIVKSLVFVAPREDGLLEPYVVLIAGPDRVDLGRLAAVVGEPGIRRATAREARDLTGFVIGGIPPFGHVRPIHVVMDPGLSPHEVVWAAAGTANDVFEIAPATLRMLSNAVVAPVAADVADAAETDGGTGYGATATPGSAAGA